MNIAIVDDEPMVLKSMEKVISEKYPEVKIACCCRTARELLDALKETDIDVVITDVCMPEMDGIELCKIICENKYDTEVIMISGYTDFDYVKKAMSYGVKQYILKPINNSKINELIKYMKLVESEKKGERELRRRIGSVEISQCLNDLLWRGDLEGIRSIVSPSDIAYKSGGVIRSYAMFIINTIAFFIKGNKLSGFADEDMFATAMSKSSDEAMLDYIVNKCADVIESIKSGDTCADETDSKAAEIRQYIDRYYNSPELSRDMLAEEFGLSARHLSRIFAKQYDKGISEYILNVRIEHAKRLLRNTNIPIDRIVTMVGYNSLQYFKQRFKEQTGFTMGKYRSGDEK